MSRFHTTEFDLLPDRAFSAKPGRFGQRITLEGSKGGSRTPPPDPRLVEAQIQSMGIQDQATMRMLGLAEDFLPVQREQLQFGLDSSRTAYDQSQQDRQWSLGRRDMLSGMQNRIVDDALSFNEPGRREQLADMASADVSSAFSNARTMQNRDFARRGVNIGSGMSAALSARSFTDEALARANAMNKTREAARLEGFTLTDRAQNALAGYPAMSMQATGSGAGFGGMGLNLANAGSAGSMAGFGSAGAMAGQMGQNATGMYNAQAQYKLGQDKLAADDGGFMGMLGTLGGAAITRYSDPRLKENVVEVGRDEVTGLTLYEFNYIGQPGTRYRGVMADEVESKFPDAVQRDDLGYASVNYVMLGIELKEVQ